VPSASASNTVVSGARHLAQQIIGIPNDASSRELFGCRFEGWFVASHDPGVRGQVSGQTFPAVQRDIQSSHFSTQRLRSTAT